jgi:Zinc carboxypeptidase
MLTALSQRQPHTSSLRGTCIPLLACVTAMALAGCASQVPLPEWKPASPAPAGASTAPPASQPGSVLPQADPVPGVQVFPLPAPSSEVPLPPVATTTPVKPPDEVPPYGPAVANRFPAPTVTYSTPGLQEGRNDFSTSAEINTWLRTQAAAARSPGRATVIVAGRSQGDQPIDAVVFTRGGATDPASLLANGKPTVLLVGQQHGDEPAGAEALLVVTRELAQGTMAPLLDRINVVLVPRANPDGTGRGQRATQGGLDMNRDHLLLQTAEAQALARLVRDYRPMVVVDAHEYTVVGRFLEKFGAVQRFDALVQYTTTPNMPEFATRAAEEWFRRPLLAALKAQSLSTEWYYTTSADPEDKKISMGSVEPETGRNVYGLKNAVSLLVETRGGGLGRLHIQRRVHTHVTALRSVLASTAQRAGELNQLRPFVEKEIIALACRQPAVVEAAPTPAQYDLMVLDPNTGLDKTLAVDWDSSLSLRTVKTRIRPCGYWLSATSTAAVDKLRLHGVQVMRVTESGSVLGDSYRELSRSTGERAEMGADVSGTAAASLPVVKAQVSLVRGVVDVPRGSFYVPMNQPLGSVALAALEPDTPSSFFANQVLAELQGVVRVMTEPAFKLEVVP